MIHPCWRIHLFHTGRHPIPHKLFLPIGVVSKHDPSSPVCLPRREPRAKLRFFHT